MKPESALEVYIYKQKVAVKAEASSDRKRLIRLLVLRICVWRCDKQTEILISKSTFTASNALSNGPSIFGKQFRRITWLASVLRVAVGKKWADGVIDKIRFKAKGEALQDGAVAFVLPSVDPANAGNF